MTRREEGSGLLSCSLVGEGNPERPFFAGETMSRAAGFLRVKEKGGLRGPKLDKDRGRDEISDWACYRKKWNLHVNGRLYANEERGRFSCARQIAPPTAKGS